MMIYFSLSALSAPYIIISPIINIIKRQSSIDWWLKEVMRYDALCCVFQGRWEDVIFI